MPRKGPAPKRPLVNDPVYGSQLVTQLVNKVLLDGKKSLAERIVYGALEQAREKTGTDPVVTLKRALDNVKPALEVRSRRVGGATYQVPVEVRAERSTTLALRWLVSLTRATFRSAVFGFFGVVVYTRVHTPRRCGLPLRAAVLTLATLSRRPLRTSC